MIHELRTYTLVPGKVPEFLKLAEEVGMPIRGDKYGKLEGFWFTDIGPLNQVVHLWSHDDLNARQANRAGLAQDEAWARDMIPQVLPLMQRQDIRLMTPALPLKPPGNSGNIYEYRNYRIKTGRAAEWLGHIKDVMPVREKYSPNVGLWHTEAGQPNEVSHLWVYSDLNARAAARDETGKDAEWNAFRAKAGSLLEEMHSTLLLPAPFSPMK